MYNEAQKQAVSEEIKANLLSSNPEMVKTAGLAASEYFRTEIRDNSVYRQIVEPTTITSDNFDPDLGTDIPSMIVEIAPHSAGATMVNFETGPEGEKFFGKNARVYFNRIMTRKYEIDKIRLEGYKMPIVDILYDLMLKDIMDVEDSKWAGVNTSIVGTNAAQSTQWSEFGVRRCIKQYFGRDGLAEIKKGMIYTKNNLIAAKQLMHAALYSDFAKLDRTEVGGDMAQDMLINGTTLTNQNGLKTLVTIKKSACDYNDVWVFTEPKYYGGFYLYKDVSMVVDEKDDIFMTFFAHETIGGAVLNREAVCRVQFTGTSASDVTNWTTAPA